MIINESHIKIEKNARYYSNEPKSREVKNICFVIHGYGQLASDFIKEFDFLDDGNTLIIAPEGLSKFYSKNNAGASWMTREDRLIEINDYVNFLEKVTDEIKRTYNISESKKYLLGFSQGVHTAVRFFLNSKTRFDHLILCSSDFPADINFDLLNTKLKSAAMHFLCGINDRIISAKRFSESTDLLKKNNIEFNDVKFEGGHEIDSVSINNILLKKYPQMKNNLRVLLNFISFGLLS